MNTQNIHIEKLSINKWDVCEFTEELKAIMNRYDITVIEATRERTI